MKKLIHSLVPLSLVASAFALAPGDAVTPEAIGKAAFVKGEAPAAWADGQVYVIECWATWCGPCLAAIPHVDELYDKYHEKGLNVIGMNVWEDGLDKVEKFVEGKGDGMSYPVAYVGKGGEFETSWLKAGGVKGIPHAFVVKDGKLLFSTHPSRLSEETIEALLAGGEEQQAIIDDLAKAEKNKAAITEQLKAFSMADGSGDTAGMEAAVKALTELDPKFSHLPRMKVDIAIAKKDWASANDQLKSMDKRLALMSSSMIVQKLDGVADEPSPALLETIEGILAGSTQASPITAAYLARVQWKLGKKEAATATAEGMLENLGRFPEAPTKAFAQSFKDGSPQTLQELMTALRAAYQPAPKK